MPAPTTTVLRLALAAAIACLPTAPAAVRINEFMSSNGSTRADEDGSFEDWIELHNGGSEAMDITGWGLSDNAGNPFKWRLPPGTVIGPGGYLLVWASGKDRVPGVVIPGIQREVWLGISGTAVTDLTGNPNFPHHPSFRETLTQVFEAPVDTDDNYGQRLQGILTAPSTGYYVFWIASDDGGELRLSATENPANATVIASVPGWTSSREWNKFASQQSSPRWLVAGRKYAIVALMKEGGGGDNLAVRWQLPGGQIEEPLPASHITSPAVSQLHANFRIASAGEPLVLTRPDGTTEDAVAPVFVPRDVARGRAPDGGDPWHYFAVATPGAANTAAPVTLPPAVAISEPRGFKSAPFQTAITCEDPAAVIRYTLDGSEPGPASPVYTAPMAISRTTTLRASVVRPGMIQLPPATVTYLFQDDILQQSATTPPGWPANRAVNYHAMEYGMRQDIVTGDNQRLRAGMTAIPSVSLVTDLGNLFAAQTGIYANSNISHGWERPVSVELIDPVRGTAGEFQIDAGLGLRGAFSRSLDNPKHSLRLFFRSAYGENRLRFPLFGEEGAAEFSQVDLMTMQNYSWAFQNDDRNTFVREIFSRDTQRDMGMPHTRSRYYHLFLNGQYWGLYLTQERGEADYAAGYLGGDSDDWDAIKTVQPGYTTAAVDGTMTAFHALHDIAVNQGFAGANANNYWRVRGLNPDGTRNPALPVLLDQDNLINYMIIAHYTGDRDSPWSLFGNFPNNLNALYNRATPGGFKWLRHDAEHSLGVMDGEGVTWDPTFLGQNITAQSQFNPATLHWRLSEHPDYRMRFADLVHKHLYGDGALTPANAKARVQARMAEIDLAIIGESARWGRGRTRDATWLPACNAVLSYLDGRRDQIAGHYRTRGWFPATAAPVITAADDAVRMAAATAFYYMTDGSDPRLPGGGVHPAAVRVDGGGGAGPVTLVPRGAVWRYSDGGAEPPMMTDRTWLDPDYPDQTWPQGPAVLGFAGGTPTNPVATQTKRWVSGTSGPQVNATYLRHEFTCDTAAEATGLLMNILRDDGVMVYLNGTELLRENMPAGTISYGTQAATGTGGTNQTTVFERASDAAGLLRPGRNVLAVSVHQNGTASSDMYFDFSLAAANTHPVTAELPLHLGVALKARAWNGSEWSPLAEFSSADLLPDGVPIHHWDFEDAAAWMKPSVSWGGGALEITPAEATAVERNTAAQGFESAHLRVNSPLGATLRFALPTTGYGAISLAYDTRRSGLGAGRQTIEYTTDGGTWTELDSYVVADADPQPRRYNLAHVMAANDNPAFAVRITFAQDAGGTAGNNRFDDFTLSGVLLPGANLPPEVIESPPHRTLVEAGTPAEVGLSGVFADPNGGEPAVEVTVSPAGVVEVVRNGPLLILTPLARGEALVTLTANDGQFAAETSFRALVYPRAHDLASGPFRFDEWSPDTPAGVFPEHIIFLQGEHDDSLEDTELARAYHIPAADAAGPGDDTFPYRAANRTRINGLDGDGIAFINTGRGRDLGGALLALDTTGLSPGQGRVSFTAGTVLPNERVYAIRLQYRLGAAGDFVDFPGEDGQPVVYVTNIEPGHATPIGPLLLPPELLGQPYLQLLWRYHLVVGDSGARAQLRLDDILVETGTPPTRYAQWQAAQFPDPADRANPAVSGPLANPAGDGVPNLLRYALDIGVDETAAGALPALLTTADGTHKFRFRFDPEKTDLVWRVRASADLTDWSRVLFDSASDPPAPLEDGWAEVPLPAAQEGGRWFLRLEVALE